MTSTFLFERKLTLEQKEEVVYHEQPQIPDENSPSPTQLGKLFSKSIIDKKLLRKRIKETLNNNSQITLHDLVLKYGGVEKGLPELIGYLDVINEFKHFINSEKTQNIVFDEENRKEIQIPEIILTK